MTRWMVSPNSRGTPTALLAICSANVTKSLILMTCVGRVGAAGEALATSLAFCRALPLSRPPDAGVLVSGETGERRWSGKPAAFAVEASQVAMELVSSLYCWYVLTKAGGSIFEVEMQLTAKRWAEPDTDV